MKTIFITSFHPLISRNILQTDVLKILADSPGRRVVILAPNHKKDYFEKTFGGKNIFVEGVNAEAISRPKSALFFKRLPRAMMNSETAKIDYGYKLFQNKQIFHFFFFRIPAVFLGRSAFFRRFVRFLDGKFAPAGIFAGIFDKYKPDLVFSTDAQNQYDVLLMQSARKRGIPVAGMIRSWDNLSVHGVLRVIPDKLLVWGDALKKEAAARHDVPAEKIAVVGVPHYDRYLRGPSKSRNDFFKEIGADISKKLILYIPIGDFHIKNNLTDQNIIKILASAGENILVRLPPVGNSMSRAGFPELPNVVFDQPGHGFGVSRPTDREITIADDERLINSLAYADVAVGSPSSVVLDAAVFGKPFILAGFDPVPGISYWEGARKLLGRTHVANMINLGAVKVAKNADELKTLVKGAIEHPEQGSGERKILLDEQCFKIDGQSSGRTAEAILSFI